eukprot:3250897-Amphidinium_carterae.1
MLKGHPIALNELRGCGGKPGYTSWTLIAQNQQYNCRCQSCINNDINNMHLRDTIIQHYLQQHSRLLSCANGMIVNMFR